MALDSQRNEVMDMRTDDPVPKWDDEVGHTERGARKSTTTRVAVQAAQKQVETKLKQNNTKQYMDVCTMSQITYVRSLRHNLMNGYNGEVFADQLCTIS